ncbi:MAG: DMT family transporter, partial [Pseudomonadota bacterium]
MSQSRPTLAVPQTETSEPKRQRSMLPLSGLLLLAGLSLVWGLNWPVMKIVLGELSIWWFRSVCLIFGGFGLLAIASMTGGRVVPAKRDIGPMLLTAVFAVGGWHVCSAFGIYLMPAGRAVIIAFTMPVWTALIAAWLLGERITTPVIVGLLLGLAGIAVLIGADLIVFQTAPLGAVFMLGAAMSWGAGTALFKRFNWSIPVAANMGWQLLA